MDSDNSIKFCNLLAQMIKEANLSNVKFYTTLGIKKPYFYDILSGIVFEIELIKQVEVNIDYILMLVAKYHKSNCEDKTILANINKSIDASVELRSKKALIEGFVTQMTVKTDVEKDWQDFVKKQKEKDLEKIIQDEKLKHDEAQKFIENSFRDGGIKTTGTDIDKILPPISRFSGGSNRALKKQTVIDKLKGFFEKYFGVI